MQQELKKTIMFVSHDIDEAVKMADKIAIFSQGELLQFSSPDEILANPVNEFVESFVGLIVPSNDFAYSLSPTRWSEPVGSLSMMSL